jgi:hypothetical protein
MGSVGITRLVSVEAQFQFDCSLIIKHIFIRGIWKGVIAGLWNKEYEELLSVVREFNPYDLYGKSDDVPDVS